MAINNFGSFFCKSTLMAKGVIIYTATAHVDQNDWLLSSVSSNAARRLPCSTMTLSDIDTLNPKDQPHA
jgi:hypothetical protein